MSKKIEAYCLNVDTQINRWVYFKQNITPYLNDFNIQRFPSIKLDKISIVNEDTIKPKGRTSSVSIREMSNLESFGTIIQDAKNRNLPYVGIFEDDIYFEKPYSKNLITNILNNELKNVDWGVLYLGCYVRDSNKGTFSKVNERLLKFNNDKEYTIWGAHSIIYNERVYDDFIEYIFNKRKYEHITDPYIAKVLCKKYQSYMVNPQILFQKVIDKSSSGMHGVFSFNSLLGDHLRNLKKNIV